MSGKLLNLPNAVYRYSKTSLRKLETCDKRLQRLFLEVSKHADVTIVCGYRSNEDQAEAFYKKKSKVKPGDSKHNKNPSLAVDAVPAHVPKLWAKGEDGSKLEFIAFAALVLSTAARLGIKVRWGGDWDMDGDYDDQTFNDYAHWELI